MSMYKTLSLVINAKLPIPINIQLKEQIKFLIKMEFLLPGDYLPTVNQLADQLAINRNTINWVYTQLKEEDLLLMQKGRRTQIKDSPHVKSLVAKKELDEIVKTSIERAIEKGYTFDEFIASTFMHHHFFIEDRGTGQFLFIECREHDRNFYLEEIKKHTGAKITELFIEDMKGNIEDKITNMDEIHGVITTLNHSEEVKDYFKKHKKPVYTIGATLSVIDLMNIAKLKEGTKVAFVCLGDSGGQWMAKRVEEAGINHIVSVVGGINKREKLEEIISSVDYIYASEAAYEELNSRAPEKTCLLPLKLERTSEEILDNLSLAKKS
ncbi:GntR family transcriptional regulator [Aneurinibacillus sp. REN35]|uniref:GntR family transcriptional regulator n=1 Tax=Aneurinibacillus sp. REN35 TaxID=3237286 RepID=UPI003527F8FD